MKQSKKNRTLNNIKYAAKIRALPIGGLLCIQSAPMFSDKILALKQNNMTLLVISYGVCVKGVSYVVAECIHHFYMRHRYVHLHVMTEAHNISESILVDYTSYSQLE